MPGQPDPNAPPPNLPVPPNPMTPGTATKTTDTVILFLHESAALIFSIVFVAVAMSMMLQTFTHGGVPFTGTADIDAYNRQKDIMLYGFSLVGTVTGYYLGRAPAERSTQQAQQTVRETQNQLTNQEQKTGEAMAQTKGALNDKSEAEAKATQIKATAVEEISTLQAQLALPHSLGIDAVAEGATTPELTTEQIQAKLTALLDKINQIG